MYFLAKIKIRYMIPYLVPSEDEFLKLDEIEGLKPLRIKSKTLKRDNHLKTQSLKSETSMKVLRKIFSLGKLFLLELKFEALDMMGRMQRKMKRMRQVNEEEEI